jgi:hypothetical protein
MCVCESVTEKGAADSLESAVTRLAYRQRHTQRSVHFSSSTPRRGAGTRLHGPRCSTAVRHSGLTIDDRRTHPREGTPAAPVTKIGPLSDI